MPGLRGLTTVQVGLESTKGTAVAATQKLRGDFQMIDNIGLYVPEYPRGVRAPSAGGGTKVRNGVIIEGQMDLDWEQIMYLLCGVDEPETSGTSTPWTHAYDPTLTAAHTYDTLTFELAVDDGSTKQEQIEAAYCTPESFAIEIGAGDIARLRGRWFGRAVSDTTITAALTEMTGRTLVPASLFTIAIDDSWANLGNTAKTLFVRSGTLEVRTGLSPKYTTDERSTLDFTGVNDGEFGGSFSFLVETTADWETEVDAYRAQTQRFFRLSVTDGTKILQLNFCGRYTGGLRRSQADGVELAEIAGEFDWDTTGTEIFTASLTNGIETFA